MTMKRELVDVNFSVHLDFKIFIHDAFVTDLILDKVVSQGIEEDVIFLEKLPKLLI